MAINPDVFNSDSILDYCNDKKRLWIESAGDLCNWANEGFKYFSSENKTLALFNGAMGDGRDFFALGDTAGNVVQVINSTYKWAQSLGETNPDVKSSELFRKITVAAASAVSNGVFAIGFLEGKDVLAGIVTVPLQQFAHVCGIYKWLSKACEELYLLADRDASVDAIVNTNANFVAVRPGLMLDFIFSHSLQLASDVCALSIKCILLAKVTLGYVVASQVILGLSTIFFLSLSFNFFVEDHQSRLLEANA